MFQTFERIKKAHEDQRTRLNQAMLHGSEVGESLLGNSALSEEERDRLLATAYQHLQSIAKTAARLDLFRRDFERISGTFSLGERDVTAEELKVRRCGLVRALYSSACLTIAQDYERELAEACQQHDESVEASTAWRKQQAVQDFEQSCLVRYLRGVVQRRPLM